MRYIPWLVGGFGLIWLAGAVESFGDLGSTPDARLPFYFVALALLGAAIYCLFKGYRGFSADLPWAKKMDEEPDVSEPKPNKPASRLVAPDPSDNFDVDAAFSRYMNKRSAKVEDGSHTQPAEPMPPARGFGRKGL